VKFLVDNSTSPRVARGLAEAEHDAVHVRERGLHGSEDEVLFGIAQQEQRILVSADTDFGTLLALRQATKPSLTLFRHGAARRPVLQLEVLLAQLGELADALEQGSLVAIEESRVRIRPLPLLRRGRIQDPRKGRAPRDP
jgi:predicted nuclease of predicted toxin-antitoxin system